MDPTLKLVLAVAAICAVGAILWWLFLHAANRRPFVQCAATHYIGGQCEERAGHRGSHIAGAWGWTGDGRAPLPTPGYMGPGAGGGAPNRPAPHHPYVNPKDPEGRGA